MASRSLGTLTVDLIAKFGGFTQGMTQAEREADKKTREMQKKMTQRARAIDDAFSGMATTIKASMLGLGVSAAAGVAGMVSIARGTARLSDEVQRFSALSNTTTSDFQRLAFGANTVGISTEKLADIFKDVQDKAGDFAQTGGGGMADFFENIAPRVGVTIEQFRRLSGPEALQLYVSSLEKANLSQQDMTFYMEAIASDSALLLPLLRNNGSAWRDLGEDAQRYGAVLSDDVIAASKAYKEESTKLEAAMQGVRNEVGGQLLPVLTEFNALMRDPETIQAIREMTGLLGGWAKAAAEAAQVVNNSSFWGWLQVGKDDAQDVDAAIVETEKKIKSLQTTVASMSRPLHKFWNADDIVIAEGQIGTLQSKLGSLYAMRDKRNASAVEQLEALGRIGLDPYPSTSPSAPFSPVVTPKGGKSQAEKDQEAAEKFLQSMRDQVQKSQERTAWEQLHYDIQAKGLKLSQDQLNQAQGMATLMDMAKEAEQGRSAEIDRQNTLYQLQERLMNAQQKHQLEMLTYGMGDQAAQELRERIALEQQQQAELRQMQHEHGQELRAAESVDQKQRLQEMFDERYRLTQEAFAKELGLYDQAVKQKQAKEKDWVAGAKAGMDTYVRDAGNGYEATKQLAQNTFRSAEDAAVQFAMTGKASASDLFSTILQGLIRIQIQEGMTKMFGGSNGGVLGSLINTGLSWLTGGASGTTVGGNAAGGFKPPGRANGGPVAAGGLYEVNERNFPELLNISGRQFLMMAGQSGYVTPLAWQGGGAAGQAAASVGHSGPAMELNIHNHAGAKIEQRQRTGSDGRFIMDIVVNEIASQISGGHGRVDQALTQRERLRG